MIADLKPYAEYKSTAQAWLGDVPEHWSVLPNRALFSEVKDRNHPDEEPLSVTPDAWIKEDATKIGYEVSFTRHFYKPQPLRTLEEMGLLNRLLKREN